MQLNTIILRNSILTCMSSNCSFSSQGAIEIMTSCAFGLFKWPEGEKYATIWCYMEEFHQDSCDENLESSYITSKQV